MPKILTYLCTRPESTERRVDQLREKFWIVQNTIQNLVGERTWSFFTEIVMDNAWLSFLVMRYLGNGAPMCLRADQVLDVAASFIGLSCAFWTLRVLCVIVIPSLGRYIAVRHMS